MTEVIFLIYFPDPFGVGNSRYFIGENHSLRQLDFANFPNLGAVVTFEASALIDDLRRLGLTIPEQIIDVSDAIRLNTGVSRADGGERKWSFWKAVKPHFANEGDWEKIRAIHAGQAAIANQELGDLSSSLLDALGKLWGHVCKELSERGESDRFWHIEVPSAQPFYNRQRNGICIREDILDDLVEAASSTKYIAYQEVSKVLNLSATGLTYWNVSDRLQKIDVGFPITGVTGYALRDQMKMASHKSDFARNFTDYLDASRDLDILSRLLEDDHKVYPNFHPIGTISSRILVSDPYLQELKRRYRGIVSPEKGFVLKYFDYAQFEPGIMANLSGDQDLINLYNDGDIYKSLSLFLFGTDKNRSLCKRIFLAFSYGMSAKGIATLLSKKDSSNEARAAIESQVESFFAKFKALIQFKIKLEQELLSTGRVGSVLGNFRYRQQKGALTSKEKRWAVSQAIQGTASLVFKHAIIGVAEKFGNGAIVLPMHDAMLVQLPNDDSIDMNIATISDVMKQSLSKFCPGIKGKVTSGAFSD